MRAAVITFPGSNCDRDLAVALRRSGAEVTRVWHEQDRLDDYDLIGVPGGFSYGDYLRCGAISARAPVIKPLVEAASRGVHILGICNGFQILTECGLLPGALIRNAGLKFVCKPARLCVASNDSAFTSEYDRDASITIPIAHHDGNYMIDEDGLKRLQDEDRIAFRYLANPNGSIADIAGIFGENRNILGLMPHPERASDPELGLTDGQTLFSSLLQSLR